MRWIVQNPRMIAFDFYSRKHIDLDCGSKTKILSTIFRTCKMPKWSFKKNFRKIKPYFESTKTSNWFWVFSLSVWKKTLNFSKNFIFDKRSQNTIVLGPAIFFREKKFFFFFFWPFSNLGWKLQKKSKNRKNRKTQFCSKKHKNCFSGSSKSSSMMFVKFFGGFLEKNRL